MLQASRLIGVKGPQPEILSESDLVSGDRLLPGCVVAQLAGINAGLQRDEECTRARVPLDWAATQNNLDNAIQILRVTPSQATTEVFRNE